MDHHDEERADAPEGYPSAEAFLEEARSRFQAAVDADRDNREAGLDDLRFCAGEQWDAGVQAERRRRGRPCLTINTLPQYVGQVIGDMRANRPSIKVRPAEDADVDTAKVRQGLIRFIENASNATSVYALAGEDQVTCGLGHFRVSLAYAADDSFDQDIRLDHIANPFAVVWDPASVEPTGADAAYCFVTDDVDRKAFEKAYPEATSSELVAPLEDGGWATRDTVRITEYWTIKERTRTLALVQRAPNVQPSIEDITDSEGEAAPFVVRDEAGRPRQRKAVRRSAVMHLITGREILEGPFELPIHRVPVFKVTGREVRVGERRYRFGLIRFAKDSIRMKNLWRSSAAEWLAMAPKQQWLLHEADEKRANRFRAAHRSDDPVLVWSGGNPPVKLQPPTAPNALLQEAQMCDADIKDVTGLHDASLGMRSNETSGKAILARESQGDVATFMYHDNLNASIREAGRVINDLLPVVYDRARTVVVLGEDGAGAPTRINDPAHSDAVDLKTGKYDIVVETGPSFSTKRVEAAESMLAFFQAVPQAGQLAGDLLAKAQDWPLADEIAERLRKALPPGMAPDPKAAAGQPPAPSDPARAQQAQLAQAAQQIALQKAQLELAEQAARTQLIQAQAAKAAAEARAMQPPPMAQSRQGA